MMGREIERSLAGASAANEQREAEYFDLYGLDSYVQTGVWD